MTKYQLNFSAKYNHGNGYIEEDKQVLYSSYLNNLLKKYELLKNEKPIDFNIDCTIFKVDKIRTMTLDEIGLHMQNEDDYSFICSFKDNGGNPI